MKKNDLYSSQEFEKILKEKMNELSTSVDCFDKISARAFPEKDPDFSDCGLTISDLENVTGRHRMPPVLKWVSAAAAIVLCIGIIPKTALINSLRNSSDKCMNDRSYNAILKDINKAADSGDYYICDMSLDEYISRDVLVTPLYSCPFEENGDNANVRLYIKMIGGVRTNQMYAVEYRGVYSEDNIIAVAESGVKFSDKEADRLDETESYFFTSDNEIAKAVSTKFSSFPGNGYLSDDIGYASAAGFSDISYYKNGKDVICLNTDVVYYQYNSTYNLSNSSDIYYYDLKITDNSGDELDIDRDAWRNAVYSNGESAAAVNNSGTMERTELFSNNYASVTEIWYFTPVCRYLPNDPVVPMTTDYVFEEFNSYNFTGNVLSQIALPRDSAFQRNLNVYLSSTIPVGVYPGSETDQAQYYSTLNYTSIYDTTSANDIQKSISELESERTFLESSSNNYTFNDEEKAAIEIEHQRINHEIDRLKEQINILEAQAKANEINQQKDMEKQRQMLQDMDKQMASEEDQIRQQSEQMRREQDVNYTTE